jgi:hypothetical protein
MTRAAMLCARRRLVKGRDIRRPADLEASIPGRCGAFGARVSLFTFLPSIRLPRSRGLPSIRVDRLDTEWVTRWRTRC